MCVCYILLYKVLAMRFFYFCVINCFIILLFICDVFVVFLCCLVGSNLFVSIFVFNVVIIVFLMVFVVLFKFMLKCSIIVVDKICVIGLVIF